MKKITCLIFAILLSLYTYGQDYSQYDRIDVYKDLTINGHIVFGITKEKMLESFGQPDKVEDFFFEMSNVNGNIFYYENGLKFYYPDYVDGFEINSNQYSVTNNNIKVGDSIENLKTFYQNSYNYALTNNKSGLVLLLNVDYYLAIIFDKETMKITNINLYEF